MNQVRLGGSFAPALPSSTVSQYRTLAASAPPHIAEVMLKLCDMMDLFHETPRSTLPGTPHPVGEIALPSGKKAVPMIVPLEAKEIARIDHLVPWEHECEMYKALFETLPTGIEGYELTTVTLPDGTTARVNKAIIADPAAKALRDAAHHLLWHAIELCKDREPLTADFL